MHLAETIPNSDACWTYCCWLRTVFRPTQHISTWKEHMLAFRLAVKCCEAATTVIYIHAVVAQQGRG